MVVIIEGGDQNAKSKANRVKKRANEVLRLLPKNSPSVDRAVGMDERRTDCLCDVRGQHARRR